MPGINISLPHSLGQEEALTRIKKLVEEVKTKFADKVTDVKEQWTENRGEFDLTVMGLSVSGIIHVSDKSVDIDGKLPFAALPFRGKIEEAIREKAKTLLA